MTCERDFPDELVEAYAAGRLDEAAAAAFEDHYFACPPCLQRLRLAQDLPEAFAAPIASARPRPRWPLGLAAAASLLLAVGLWRVTQPPAPSPGASATPAPASPTRAERLFELGRFEPPAWSPETLRGAASSPSALEQGLRRYQAGDWAGAAPWLERAAQAAPRDPRPAFYLGATWLLEGRLGPGVDRLRQVVALGDTPYLEEAHFLLAHASLLQGDGPGARREIEAVLALKGDLEEQSRDLLQRLEAIEQAGP